MGDDALQMILAQLASMSESNKQIGERLSALEEKSVKSEAGGSGAKAAGEGPPFSTGTTQILKVQAQAKEKALSLTFGDGECSANSLRLFIEHFNIARTQNMAKQVGGWDEAEFRANELRFQLRGDPALWLAQECAMLKTWTRNDDEIIAKLKDRYMGTQSTELNIIAFEELSQNANETLAHFMTRCQQKGYEAFGELNEPLGTQQRIVWKFLSGVRDPQVRQAVIREKWMKSPTETKSFEEVLKIAETAKMNNLATLATGPGSGNEPRVKVAAASRVQDRRTNNKSRTPYSSSESGRSSNASSNRSDRSVSSSPLGGNFNCHYCNTTSHYGGWKMCEKRKAENPNWTPKDKEKGFQ